jgi:hypothetical protein
VIANHYLTITRHWNFPIHQREILLNGNATGATDKQKSSIVVWHRLASKIIVFIKPIRISLKRAVFCALTTTGNSSWVTLVFAVPTVMGCGRQPRHALKKWLYAHDAGKKRIQNALQILHLTTQGFSWHGK